MDSIHISLQAETLGYLFGLPITNSLVLSLVTAFSLVGGGFLVAKRLKWVPGKAQGMVELIIGGLLDFMAQVVGDRKQALTFFPLVATIFLFILFNNWIGVLPGIGSFGFYTVAEATEEEIKIGEEVGLIPEEEAVQLEKELKHEEKEFVPFFRSANADLNTTFALAIIAVFAVQLYAIQKLGFFAQVGKYIDFKHGPIHFFVGLLEIVGEFARIVSFSFRLFGNIFAGEVLLVIIMTLVPVVIPLPFIFLEFFVGFIQALVFAMLTLVFLKVATMKVEPEH
ncbi:MAG: F0F1 ATP synthase subunit A [Candidatus Wildermuthbacteria bacterium]|nr:F0F1 ATP synthase subunit A [Candidatus Wildermuthbacteria bacterium]